MATPAQALARLRAEPDAFLNNYYLKVERAMGQNGPTQYWFGAIGHTVNGRQVYDRTARPGRILGNLRMHNSKNFKFSQHHFQLLGDMIQPMVWHVDVSAANAIAINNIPSVQVSRGGGPDVVVTTLLNGCTFACEPRPTHVLMAHVQPLGTTPALLETNVTANGILAGGTVVGAATVFGGGISYQPANHDVTIIGVRDVQQRWNMYAQIHPRGTRECGNVVQFFQG